MDRSKDSRPRPSFALAFLIVVALITTLSCTKKASFEKEVWAEIDGQLIFRDQVERIHRSRITTGSDGDDPEQALSLKLNILNELITNRILIAHASRSRITVSEAEVDTKIAQLESPYSKEEFQKKVKDQGLEMSDLRQQVRESLLINKLINKEISSRMSVTDVEIASYYARNKVNFNVPETQYHLAQIEVTPTADPEVRNLKNDDAKNAVDAQRKIQALYARLRVGEDFAAVAQEYSEDPKTAAGGGDMGFIPASTLNSSPQLKQVVKSLKPGQISGIIPSPHGYHIVKLLGREEAGQHPLSDPQVQSSIRQALMNEKDQLLKAAYLEVLRNRSKVVNYLAEQIVGGKASVHQ